MLRSVRFGTVVAAMAVGCGGTDKTEDELGTSSHSIVGGTEAKSTVDYPGMAALVGRSATTPYRAFCGGVLIAPRWVLTAAHCFDNGPLRGGAEGLHCKNTIAAGDRTQCEVALGSADWRDSHDPARGAELNRTFFQITKIYRHSRYGIVAGPPINAPFVSNLALVELESAVPVTTARPAAILTNKWYPRTSGGAVIAAGWGATSVSGDIFAPSFTQDPLLKIAQLTNYDLNCVDAAGPAFFPDYNVVNEPKICAGDRNPTSRPRTQTYNGTLLAESSQGTCHGDGGGPLYYDIPDAGRTAIAITSASVGCALLNERARFTRTSAALLGLRMLRENDFALERPIKGLVTPGFWNTLTWRGYYDFTSTSNWDDDTWFHGTAAIHAPMAGNFTNTGYSDIAYYGRCNSTGTPCWRVHHSKLGSGFTTANFGTDMTFQGTNPYNRPVAGDFNNDGLSDIAYWGLCGTQPCWQVHENQNGERFSKRSYGADARFASSDVTSTPVVGDFNADDYDDIAYIGRCGTDSHQCLRAHINDRNGSFEAKDYRGVIQLEGRDANNTPLAGDFNGDGYDDIAYYGLCPEACWRVHLNTQSGRFSDGASYGSSIRFRGNDVTGTPVAADLNGDGFTDIAYSAYCGSNNQSCLRTHLNNQRGGFAVGGHGDVMAFEGNDANNTPMAADFDADGSTDMAYYGVCDRGTCWRVHLLPN